jgi:hypothetical protein
LRPATRRTITPRQDASDRIKVLSLTHPTLKMIEKEYVIYDFVGWIEQEYRESLFLLLRDIVWCEPSDYTVRCAALHCAVLYGMRLSPCR